MGVPKDFGKGTLIIMNLTSPILKLSAGKVTYGKKKIKGEKTFKCDFVFLK